MHPLRDLTPTVATLGRWEGYVYINTIVYYINHHIYQIAMSNTIVGPFLSLFGRFMISVHLCYLKSLPAAHAVCNLIQICNMVKYLLINHCFCTLCVVLVSGESPVETVFNDLSCSPCLALKRCALTLLLIQGTTEVWSIFRRDANWGPFARRSCEARLQRVR